jgi:kynurenine 3-monooxygenase
VQSSHHSERQGRLDWNAAHAVSASLAQGCSSVLQDVMILNGLLKEYKDDWSK